LSDRVVELEVHIAVYYLLGWVDFSICNISLNHGSWIFFYVVLLD